MGKIETGQLAFAIGPEEILTPIVGPDKPVVPEKELRVDRLITLSDIETIIYRHIIRVEPRNLISASQTIGSAIDQFLIPAEFIYRMRGGYCFTDQEWDLEKVFTSFYPTGWGHSRILELLAKYRSRFIWEPPEQEPAVTRQAVKSRIPPLWEDIAKEFKLDTLNLQAAMTQEGNLLLPSGQTASEETIREIGQRIVNERFDFLVRDDPDYTYIARPDCLIPYELDGQTFFVQVQPDYIKRQREDRKSTRARHIVTKRIVGDYKDSDRQDLFDSESPFGQTMLVYNWLLAQIAQKFRWPRSQPVRVRTLDRRVRRVFSIPEVVKRPLSQEQIQTAIEFLKADGAQMFQPMPTLTPQDQERAKEIFEEALRISQGVRI